MRLDRHQLVYLHPSVWPGLLDARTDLQAITEIGDWAGLGRPLIARAALCHEAADALALGLPLPPAMGKQRLAFVVPAEAVLSVAPPPLVSDAIDVAPSVWRPTLTALVAAHSEVRCFGSLAWEYLTGLSYLSATSDVDLLWQVSTAGDADDLVTQIVRIEAVAPMRLDGEIITPDGSAVQWREWADGAPDLLVKAADGSRMVARESLFA